MDPTPAHLALAFIAGGFSVYLILLVLHKRAECRRLAPHKAAVPFTIYGQQQRDALAALDERFKQHQVDTAKERASTRALVRDLHRSLCEVKDAHAEELSHLGARLDGMEDDTPRTDSGLTLDELSYRVEHLRQKTHRVGALEDRMDALESSGIELEDCAPIKTLRRRADNAANQRNALRHRMKAQGAAITEHMKETDARLDALEARPTNYTVGMCDEGARGAVSQLEARMSDLERLSRSTPPPVTDKMARSRCASLSGRLDGHNGRLTALERAGAGEDRTARERIADVDSRVASLAASYVPQKIEALDRRLTDLEDGGRHDEG